MSQTTISGAVSGLDTTSIINSLVSVQQNQQTLLKNQQTAQQSAADSYAALITSLGSLATLAKGVATTADWSGATASSSSTGVKVSATGTIASSFTFDVDAVAHAHAVVSADTVTSLSATVAGASITVTKGGVDTPIDVGSGSLADVVAAVNASSAGLTAAAVQTAPGQYRLQIAASATGSDSAFTVAGLTGFTGMGVLTTGDDAKVTVGTLAGTKYSATSSTNTFAALVPGMSFTVSKPETAVTVSSAVDGTSVGASVQKMVDAANAVLTKISTATAYDATKKTGGPLLGDSTARSLQQGILDMVSGAGAPGISLTRDGQLSFDSVAFNTAFAANPSAVAGKYGATSTFAPAAGVTSTVTFGSATSATRGGAYAVQVTSAAAAEKWQFSSTGLTAGSVISLTRGAQSISYTVPATPVIADIATALNDLSASAGFGVGVAAGGTGLLFTAIAAGTASAFTLTPAGADVARLTAGADVVGTIDGQEAAGLGNVLTLTTGTGNAVGLSVAANITAAEVASSGGNIGTVSYAPGLAQLIGTFVADQTTAGTGMLASAQTGRESSVKSFQDQIDSWDLRLSDYRASLLRQFTAMETAMSTLKSQAAFLTSASAAATTSTTTG